MTTPDVYTLTRRGLWHGARASMPLGVASAVLGAGFGVAARQVDLALWATLFMSGSVFAGAAQFAVLQTGATGVQAPEQASATTSTRVRMRGFLPVLSRGVEGP